MIPAIGVILCFVLAWIGVEHAIRVWFAWFLRGHDRALLRRTPYWVSPMRNKAPKRRGTPAS